ncbi:hypothetical protein DevBK_00040 [Devosia sp. BK]|uniref:hypothetical protein n=1 Tax=Devosia sp. BK TaxID=2871706 RepID=UPI00293A9842|nr:hypothetical protein [Devosia sp. BK]MDV3249710.1 hypothetical protein [Devosia sp. BK]
MKPAKKTGSPGPKDELPDNLLEKVAGGGQSGLQGGEPADGNVRPEETAKPK